MRFKITFNRTGRQRMLPMDYQYYLSAWIYKVIGRADPEFSQFLHSQGYANGTKQFRLFNYSPLNFGKPILWKERSLFEIAADRISMQVSFYMPDAAERFIVGLFNNQEVFVGDKFNGIDLAVAQIERIPEHSFSTTITHKALSPIVISFQDEGEKYARYLSPEDEGYQQLVKNNLTQKWNILPNVKPFTESFNFNMKPTSVAKSKLITIKPNTPEQSKVRGFVYNFSLTCPPEIHQLILACGIGEKNSMGFGWCEVK